MELGARPPYPRALAKGGENASLCAIANTANVRGGAFTIVVLICLLISAMVLASLLKLALLDDGQSRNVQMRLQSVWLADSGLERAAARVAADPAYAGETWTIDAERMGGPDAATVVIRVEKDESQAQQRVIVVVAVYPAEGTQQARLTRHTTITLAQER